MAITTWIALTMAALGFGLALSFLSDWLPRQIYKEEAEWLNAHTDTAVNYSYKTHLDPNWKRVVFIGCSICFLLPILVKGPSAPILCGAIFCAILFMLAIVDIRTMLLPDRATIGLIWVGLLIQIYPDTQIVNEKNAILGVIFGYGLLRVVGQSYLLVRKKLGLGHGDMKLLAASGAWLGATSLPAILIIGGVSALMFKAASYLIHKQSIQAPFAFGPWLAFGAVAYFIVVL